MQNISSSQLTIAKDLISKIESKALQRGDHLRERELAKNYGVSRTLIRGALDLLVESGALEKHSNRGFFVPETLAEISMLPSDPIDAIYAQATRDWFEQRVPATFTDTDFQQRYKVSRPLVKRVLARLSQDGIIERNAGQGWHFPPTLNTRSAHDDSYAFRKILEPAGILEPGFKFDKEEADALEEQHLQALQNSAVSTSAETLFVINSSFHEVVAKWSGNQFILSSIVRQNRLRRLLEYASLPDSNRRHQSLQEHLDILSLLRKGDNLEAAALMKRHLRASEAVTSDRMKL